MVRFHHYLILAVLIGAALPVWAASPADPNTAAIQEALRIVDRDVIDQLKTRGYADYFIVLASQADLGGAKLLYEKTDRGRWVFETLTRFADQTQAPIIAELKQRGATYRAYYIQNMILVRDGDYDLLLDMVTRNDVTVVRANRKVTITEPQPLRYPANTPARAPEWNLSHIGITDVWAEGITGEGIVVANLDTGVDWDHPALKQKYRGWNGSTANHDYNWHACSTDSTCPNASIPCDNDQHGTHTMGTMVGDDGAGNQVGGAPGAKWIACGHLEDEAGFHECFEWFLAPYRTGEQPSQGLPEMAPDVVNNSWGWPTGGGDYQYAPDIDALQAAGVFMEFSAGNEGDDCTSLRSPGDYPQVLTTGASDVQNRIVSYSWTSWWGSSRGPAASGIPGAPNFIKPEIVAPGYDIRSSVPGTGYEGGWGGTSMAGPHTCAVVALMWSAAPSLIGDIEATRQIILDNAYTEMGGAGYWNQTCNGINAATTVPNHVWGWGLIDAYACYEALAGVYLDRGAYMLTDTIGIMVRNRDASGSVQVLIESSTEPTPETVTLPEISTGVFSASIPCAPGTPSYGNGILSVSHGDQVLVNYAALDRADEAIIDGVVPAISNVSIEEITDSTAMITFNTNEPCQATLHYGEGITNLTYQEDGLSQNHSILLEGLNDCAGYLMDIEAADQAGNTVFDNNGGAHYTFITQELVTLLAADMSTNPNWTISGGQWAWGQPTGQGGDPTGGYTGSNVYGYNLNGSYANSIPEYYLTAPSMNCSDTSYVSLSFYRWLGVESATWDHAKIQITSNGSTWNTVWEHTGSSFQDTAWTHVEYDLSSWAAGNSNVQIRWVMGATDSSVTYSGWNIDDVVVSYTVPCGNPTSTPQPTYTPTATQPPTATYTPAPTYTPVPTATPQFTYTPEPTATSTNTPVPPSPTPTPIAQRGMNLMMDDMDLTMGEHFRLHFSIGNPDATDMPCDAYILLGVYGMYWSWPSWSDVTTNLDKKSFSIPSASVHSETALEFDWPSGVGSASGLQFIGATFTPGAWTLIGDVRIIEWQYH